MGEAKRLINVNIDRLVPYENNAKIHGEEQIKKIQKSIERFGFLSPILIDKDKNIIAGHGRVQAAKGLGFESVPCICIEGLTEAERRAYILADNRLSEFGKWDFDLVAAEIGHRLGEVAAKKAGISQRDIVERAGKTVNIKTENMAGHISKYARSNYGETIAEASADVFCNGKKASKASKAIMSEVKKILK